MNLKIIIAFLIPVLLSLSLVSCKREEAREQEPNNSFDKFNLIEIDRVIIGTVSSASDNDYYMVDIAESGSFDVDLTAVKGVNTEILIFKKEVPSPVLLKKIDDNRKSSPERMRNIWFDQGRYFLVIRHGDRDEPKGDDESKYRLKVSLRKQQPLQEREPNDSFEQATQIEAGKEYSGFYSPAFDKLKKDSLSLVEEDYYSIKIEASPEKPLVADITVNGAPGVTPVLSLYDPDKNLISKSISSVVGSNIVINGVGLTRAGKYYISVSSVSFETNNINPYNIIIEIKDYDKSSELEPNDSIEKANNHVNYPVNGTIFPRNDKDYYKVEIKEPALVTVDSSFSAGVDGSIKAFNSTGEKVIEANSFGESKNERIPSFFTKSDIFIEISGKLSNQVKDGTYELMIQKEPYREEFEVEPNNDKDTATRFTGTQMKGFLSYRKDRDYYFFDYGKRVSSKFTITGIENAVFTVSLTDQHGYIVRSERISNKNGATFRDTIDSKAYLIIESDRDNPFEPYSITVSDR